MKTCTKCGVEKDLTNFYIRPSRGTYRSECTECWRKRCAERDKRPKTPKPPVEPTGEYKTCGKCQKDIDTSQFHKSSQNADGLHTYCKACRSEAKEKPQIGESWIRPRDLEVSQTAS